MGREPKFDRYQFDPAMHGGKLRDLLSFSQKSIFGEERLEGTDFREFSVLNQKVRSRKDTKVFTDPMVLKVILTAAFPLWKTSPTQYERMKRWVSVIYLYWHCGLSISFVAKLLRAGKPGVRRMSKDGKISTHLPKPTKAKIKRVEDTINRIRKQARLCRAL